MNARDVNISFLWTFFIAFSTLNWSQWIALFKCEIYILPIWIGLRTWCFNFHCSHFFIPFARSLNRIHLFSLFKVSHAKVVLRTPLKSHKHVINAFYSQFLTHYLAIMMASVNETLQFILFVGHKEKIFAIKSWTGIL